MARIFIAIRFNDDVKNTFVNIQNALRTKGVRGNYCPYNNLHLTLAFIGEKYDLQNIYKAVSEVTFKPFTMTLGELGTFPTKTGVIWCGNASVTRRTGGMTCIPEIPCRKSCLSSRGSA